MQAQELLGLYRKGKRDFAHANLSWANLRGANLRGANLSRANLSGATGVLVGAEWLAANFETDSLGLIVYKAIGDTYYCASSQWVIAPGSFIEEVVNPCRVTDCACGVNVATKAWVEKEYAAAIEAGSVQVWKCRIHSVKWLDMADVVVPYQTDGKFRCGRLELLEEV